MSNRTTPTANTTTPAAGRLRYALAGAGRGWAVFPVTPGGKTPAIPAAHSADDPARRSCRGACGRPGHGVHDATTDPDRIRAWWTHCPDANVGIATGPASRLLVVDLDVPKPGQNPPPGWDLPGVLDGRDAFALVCERAGHRLPLDTFTVTTRRGGLHLYYALPDGREHLGNTSGTAGRGLGWCIDTRGAGGYVVGPGSHVTAPDGTDSYEVLHGPPAAPLPAWLADALAADPVPATPAATASAVAHPAGYLGAALRGEVQRVLDARPGTRNHTLNRAAYNLGRHVAAGTLAAELARDALVQAALAVGLGEAEATATITSGLRARQAGTGGAA
jgi:hypothetical protein